MIKFNFSIFDSDASKLRKIIYENEYAYPDILEITGKFEILINGNVFFSEPYFPILEFLKDVLAWINCSDESKEMFYSSIETDNNPLIAFIKKDTKWIIYSPWQKYECTITFTKTEIIEATLCLVGEIGTQGDGSPVLTDN